MNNFSNFKVYLKFVVKIPKVLEFNGGLQID